MSDLIVVGYGTEYRAEEVRLGLIKREQDDLVDLEDAVVAIRDREGHLKLNQNLGIATSFAGPAVLSSESLGITIFLICVFLLQTRHRLDSLPKSSPRSLRFQRTKKSAIRSLVC
jgi:uncharacterized membrane protein